FSVRSEINGMIRGLGFAEEDKERSISTLSGGQKTRVALAKLLLKKPSLIMLDEPTNHLDLRSIEWLEGFLQSYKGAVLIVAHDRYFLDRIVTKVFEIENGKLSVFTGDYSTYAARKKELRDTQMKAYLNQQAEIAHQEQVIDKLKSFNREKSIKRAESREKMLDKIERLDKPADTDDAMKLKITPSIISGRDVLSVSELSKGYDGMKLFEGVSFDIRRGERVAVIGDNGTGKTTLLKIITGNLEADNGSFSLGVNVKPGYYDQEHQVLHPDKTLFREISDDFPAMDNTKIRNTLAAFLFYGDDVFKQVSALSGGERGRLSLAKLMLGNANFLILDEPTNHLDITSKEILENALNEYEGTVLYVSHDRYFINRTATRILALEGGTFT
ncbi:MAG TPA: ABC transporter, partial [Lachnospiraceae bacterium]|nr:ABC transporter [Lachnospiraceae bacterium]